MDNCIFCKIVNGEIPSKKVYEDDSVAAFYDIEPQAPVHVLIIPKAHYASTLDLDDTTADVVGKMVLAANKIAKELGINESGFRLVMNTGRDAGQTVAHLHMHLMGGREFTWPAG